MRETASEVADELVEVIRENPGAINEALSVRFMTRLVHAQVVTPADALAQATWADVLMKGLLDLLPQATDDQSTRVRFVAAAALGMIGSCRRHLETATGIDSDARFGGDVRSLH